MDKRKIEWLKKPEDHNYPAAFSYLALVFTDKQSRKLVKKLKRVRIVHFKAKDIFRASRLSLLGISNSHVDANILKIKMKKSISPILLVRSQRHGRVIIADGYHRLCAVYQFNEDELIPCRIV